MQPAAYFAPIWQICSRASCRVRYQVETLFMNFSVSTAKKGCRQGKDLGFYGNPWSKQQFHSNSTGTKTI
jgi:hypothetical protein